MFKIFIFSLLCIKFLVPEKIKIVDHKSWHKAPSTLHTNYILLRGDSPIQWGRCHGKCLEPWMSSQIVPACLGHLWSMILKTNSNPEMDLYLLHLISLHSPCLSDRAKIYDSGILCLTASLSHLGIAYLFSPSTFDHWVWLSEACTTMNLGTTLV